jgi:hypothetical protein
MRCELNFSSPEYGVFHSPRRETRTCYFVLDSSDFRLSHWISHPRGYETRRPEGHFQSGEQPKVTWSEVRRMRWLGYAKNVLLDEELPYNKRRVAR